MRKSERKRALQNTELLVTHVPHEFEVHKLVQVERSGKLSVDGKADQPRRLCALNIFLKEKCPTRQLVQSQAGRLCSDYCVGCQKHMHRLCAPIYHEQVLGMSFMQKWVRASMARSGKKLATAELPTPRGKRSSKPWSAQRRAKQQLRKGTGSTERKEVPHSAQADS